MKYIFDVTIGIVVKNMENTILNAINSTFNQDYPHERIEIIVVDGYSIDKTVDILKLHLDINDIKYEIFFEKVGLGYARQIVVNNAKGKYIIWLDGDMILSKEYVKKMITQA
jgi:glycosyltransferase involved in cell wall biosynthesis